MSNLKRYEQLTAEILDADAAAGEAERRVGELETAAHAAATRGGEAPAVLAQLARQRRELEAARGRVRSLTAQRARIEPLARAELPG